MYGVFMKKFLSILFVLTMVNLPCFSAITPEEATSIEYLNNRGYSQETSRLVDLQKRQINGQPVSYKSNDPDWYHSNKPVNFVRKLFMYLDCGLDDQKFGQNNIEYTTKWDEL